MNHQANTFNGKSLPDVFAGLIQSTISLHQRFGTNQTLEDAYLIFMEEYNEWVDEGMKHPDFADGDPSDTFSLDSFNEEMVDVFVTLVGLSIAMSKREGKNHYLPLINAMQAVTDKNNAKDETTHYLNEKTGKVTRRE